MDKYENKVKEKIKKELNEEEKEEIKKKKREEKFSEVDKKIQKTIKGYTDEIFAKKLCGCICGCICRCKCAEKSDFNKFKNKICDNITKINEEVAKTFRKAYIIDILKDKLRNKNYEEKNIFRSLMCIKCLWFVFLFMLIILESPFQMLIKEKTTFSYNFADFVFCISIYLFFVIFYFSIFIYSAINHKYIEGDLIFGKKSEHLNFLNFINVVYSLSNAAIYHSLWTFNKNGFIKAKFYDIFFLPENIINIPIKNKYYSIKSLNIIAYSTLMLIILFIFFSSKFTELKICKKSLYTLNENTEFFFSEPEFYLYFLLGLKCKLYYKKIEPKESKNEEFILFNSDSLNISLKDENDDTDE